MIIKRPSLQQQVGCPHPVIYKGTEIGTMVLLKKPVVGMYVPFYWTPVAQKIVCDGIYLHAEHFKSTREWVHGVASQVMLQSEGLMAFR